MTSVNLLRLIVSRNFARFKVTFSRVRILEIELSFTTVSTVVHVQVSDVNLSVSSAMHRIRRRPCQYVIPRYETKIYEHKAALCYYRKQRN